MQPDWTAFLSPPPPPPLTLRWATAGERTARVFGQLTSKEAFNFKTLAPIPGGLFDIDVFGDTRGGGDYEARVKRFGELVLPVPMLHPLWRTRFGVQLEAATGWAAHEIDGLADYTSSIGPDGALVPVPPDDPATSGCAAILARLEKRGESTRCVLRSLLILPAELRPFGEKGESEELNDAYRAVLDKALRVGKLFELAAPLIITIHELGALQRLLDQLFDNEMLDGSVTTRLDDVDRAAYQGDRRRVSLAGLVTSDAIATWVSGKELAQDSPGLRGLGAMEAMGFTVGR